jgi:hypothetical protein
VDDFRLEDLRVQIDPQSGADSTVSEDIVAVLINVTTENFVSVLINVAVI